MPHPDAAAAKRPRAERSRHSWAYAASAQLRRIPESEQRPPERYALWDHELDVIIATAYHAGRRQGKWYQEARQCNAEACGECEGCARQQHEASHDDGGDIVQLVQRSALLGLIGHYPPGTTLKELPAPPHQLFKPDDARWRRAAHVAEMLFRRGFRMRWSEQLFRDQVDATGPLLAELDEVRGVPLDFHFRTSSWSAPPASSSHRDQGLEVQATSPGAHRDAALSEPLPPRSAINACAPVTGDQR